MCTREGVATTLKKAEIVKLAERVGFEPTMGTRPITVFETAPINHSGISPTGFRLYLKGRTAAPSQRRPAPAAQGAQPVYPSKPQPYPVHHG